MNLGYRKIVFQNIKCLGLNDPRGPLKVPKKPLQKSYEFHHHEKPHSSRAFGELNTQLTQSCASQFVLKKMEHFGIDNQVSLRPCNTVHKAPSAVLRGHLTITHELPAKLNKREANQNNNISRSLRHFFGEHGLV